MIDGVWVRPEAAGRPARTVGRHRVVTAAIGAEGVHGSDGNDRRLVTWRMNLPIDFLSGVTLPIIAGGRHDNDACISETPHCLTQRIVQIRINCRGADAHIHHANVVKRVISHHPIQRRQ